MRSLALVVVMFLASLATAVALTIPAAEASKHVGEQATVCGTIASQHTAYRSRGTPTFINLDQPYPNQIFTALIWGNERTQVGEIPASGRLCVTGRIQEYRGTPEIVLHNRNSWLVPK